MTADGLRILEQSVKLVMGNSFDRNQFYALYNIILEVAEYN